MKCLICLFLALVPADAQTSSSRRVAGPAPATAPKPEVKPEDKCQIEGTVVNAMTGEPLKKAHLSLRPNGQPDAPYGTFTDNAGHFLLDDIDPGRYFLTATRNGFVTQGLSTQGSARQITALDLAPAQKMKEVVLKLFPQGVITGHITDEDGEPLASVMVQCMRVGYPRGKKQLMPANGTSTNDLGDRK